MNMPRVSLLQVHLLIQMHAGILLPCQLSSTASSSSSRHLGKRKAAAWMAPSGPQAQRHTGRELPATLWVYRWATSLAH